MTTDFERAIINNIRDNITLKEKEVKREEERFELEKKHHDEFMAMHNREIDRYYNLLASFVSTSSDDEIPVES
jgi:hypothetical protein